MFKRYEDYLIRSSANANWCLCQWVTRTTYGYDYTSWEPIFVHRDKAIVVAMSLQILPGRDVEVDPTRDITKGPLQWEMDRVKRLEKERFDQIYSELCFSLGAWQAKHSLSATDACIHLDGYLDCVRA